VCISLEDYHLYYVYLNLLVVLNNLNMIRCLFYICLNLFFGKTLKSNDIPCGVMSGFLIFNRPISEKRLLNLYISKPNTHQEMLSDWSIYLTIFHKIGRSNMNKRLNNMTSNRMLLDVSVLPKKNNKYLIVMVFIMSPLQTKADILF
jgi:hypothetical protein